MIPRFSALLAPAAFVLAIGCGGRTPTSSYDAGGGGGAGGGGALDGSPSACTAGTVTFHLSAADGKNASYCTGRDCTAQWVDVQTREGQPMPIEFGCSTNCEGCQPIGCPLICIAPKRLPANGETLTWDGTYWPSATCGRQQVCREKRCAAPGRYVARMCAAASTSDAGMFCTVSGAPRCVDVEFDYPSAVPVEGAI
jgi:hypothetical protein